MMLYCCLTVVAGVVEVGAEEADAGAAEVDVGAAEVDILDVIVVYTGA